MILDGLLGRHRDIVQARCLDALFVTDQFHQQHAVEAAVRFRHAHAGPGESIKSIHLGVLPGLFLLPAAKARTLLHRARAAAVAHLATFLILHCLLETTLVGFLVNLGAANLAAATHDEHVGFLAAHQWTDHFVDQAVFDQGFDSFGDFHRGLIR